MRTLLCAMICVVLLFGTAAAGHAARDGWHGGIRGRIHDAMQNIERGIDHGSLSRQEARGLKRELEGIVKKMERMKKDGYLSQREREKIDQNLDRLERDIRREKRDDDPDRGFHRRPH